jgi:hypothetical protein
VVAPEILVLTEKTRVCVCVFFMGTSMVAVGWAGAAGRYNATDTCGEWVESAGKASQTPGNPQCVAAGGAYNMGVSFSVFSAPPTNTHSLNHEGVWGGGAARTRLAHWRERGRREMRREQGR